MSATKTQEISDLTAMIDALRCFSQFDPKMQVSTILTLLEIARANTKGNEIALQDIEKLIGLQSGTASRNVYYWGRGQRDVSGAHNMVDMQISLTDARRRDLKLNPKGKAFINQVLERLTHGSSKRHDVAS